MSAIPLLGCILALMFMAAGVQPAPREPPDRPPAPAVSSPLQGEAGRDETEINARMRERGRFLYELYCSDCHGPSGRGDGPAAADMDPGPADLSLLSRRAGGEFPFLEAYEVIDGRSRMETHQRHGMPVWGLRFQERDKDTSQADEIRGRILQLLHYLRSIQVEEEAEAQR